MAARNKHALKPFIDSVWVNRDSVRGFILTWVNYHNSSPCNEEDLIDLSNSNSHLFPCDNCRKWIAKNFGVKVDMELLCSVWDNIVGANRPPPLGCRNSGHRRVLHGPLRWPEFKYNRTAPVDFRELRHLPGATRNPKTLAVTRHKPSEGVPEKAN